MLMLMQCRNCWKKLLGMSEFRLKVGLFHTKYDAKQARVY